MVRRRMVTNLVSGALASLLVGGSPAVAATFTVTTTGDAGSGSLRDALAHAKSGDTIAITVGGVIALTSGPLLVRQNVTIIGPGRDALTISAGHAFRVFSVGDVTPVAAAISGLTIQDGSADFGGGIVNGATLTLSDMRVSGNTAIMGGGILNSFGAVLTMHRTVVSGNVAAVGGGLANDSGAARIDTSSFTDNAALQSGAGSGGGIYNGGNGGPVDISSSTFAHNTTDGEGGAIYAALGSLTIANTTITGNTSTCNWGGCSGGGGIVSNSAVSSIVNSTLYANVTDPFDYLGGNLLTYYGTTTVRNSIIAGSGGHNCLTYSAFNIVSAGYNLSDDSTCAGYLTAAGDVNGVPAGLSPSGLRDNGGLTQTIALLATSPAVDAIPLSACVDSAHNPAYDQRGVIRPQGSACDMGAVELTFTPAALDLAAPSPSSFVAGTIAPLVLSATLTRSDGTGPIAGGAVSFVVDGISVGTSTTDSTGSASLSYVPAFLSAGDHAIQAVAARQTIGDESFDAASSAQSGVHVTPSPYTAQVLQPIRTDGSSVFHVNRSSVPVKFTLTYNGSPTCDLPAGTVYVTRLSGAAPGPVNESDYVLPADAGSSFRVDSCQYVYNLGATSLGPGTFVVSLAIGTTIVGSGTFGLQ